ncbi:hypothetical protein BKA66DRAFT_305975 [Pyrenochaeta sp. MPI-SDFR-AT-0127]|nr:hypothetical protein BKA66DRAFT_305975 [Pyrenochaeta sp. MPI-SDFR-AT-0127]
MFTADSESTLGEGTIEERCGGSDRAKQVVPSETTPLLTNAHRQQLSNAAQTQRQHHHTTTEDATYSARNGPMSYVAASAEAFSRTTGIRLEKIKRVLDKESLSFRPSWFQSWKKNSQVLSIDPSSRSKRPPREPLAIFKDLLDLLVAHQVPGPMLFRMQTEFTDRLGHGRTFEAFGVSEKRFLKNLHIGSLQPDRIKDIESIAKALPKIAVKRAYVDDLDASRRSASSAPTTATRAFGQQLYCVEREIKNLCNPALRGHPNIVRLLAWGLCLDTLEDVSGSVPRIPLLVLERANHSLVDFIEARPMSNSTDAEGHLYAKISLDIGQGLSAIHDAGMIHGDVKLQNILMFHEEGNWVAKLSDFGLTVAAHPDSGTGYDVDYRGTPRWCPPPGSSRYVLGDLFSFDYFAYGLVLWCLFLNRTTSPMPPDDAILEGPEGPFAPINLYNTAMAQLLRANGAVSNRTRLIMRSCIHDDPRLWRTRPWRYLDPEKFPVIGSVSDSVTFPILAVGSFKKLLYQSAVVMATSTEYSINVSRIVVRQVVREPVRLTTHALPTLSTVYTLERAAGTWAGLRRVFTKHWSERRREVESAAKLVKSWRHLAIDPGATNIISHPKTHQCGDYSQLYSSLVSQLIGDATNRSSPRSYALARLRSRIPYCCYQASYHGSEDFVSLALQFPCDIDILAWLCKGEVGRHEVGSLDPHVKFQALEPGSAEIVERFILLAENGYRLDESRWDGVAERRQSLLDAMLCNVWASGLDALPIVHCLSRLQRFAVDRRSSASMPPSLRYFLTGHGLPDTLGEVTQSDTTEFWTTALHECVSLRFYDAVEALVMGGFEVNCLNAEGKTALQTLFETTDLSEDNSHALDRDRIIALLKQRPAKVWHPEFIPSSKQHLPMGWSQIKVRTDPLGADSHRMYQERHFGSLTFQRPTFSFFSDQRLALGFRKVSVPGQTYHLDLLRFITDPLVLPSRSKPIEWKYSDQYYAAEAAKSDELELYTMRWIAVSMVTVCWDLTFWTWTGLQELPSVMAAIVPQSRLAFLIAEILLVPLVRYSPYGFIPLSCTSWMEESRAVKALIDLSALGALCNIIQGSMSYFLAQDGNGLLAI